VWEGLLEGNRDAGKGCQVKGWGEERAGEKRGWRREDWSGCGKWKKWLGRVCGSLILMSFLLPWRCADM
jgi:hypothetical protein